MTRSLALVALIASLVVRTPVAATPASAISQCVLALDGSGSTVDAPVTRAWALSEVAAVLEAHNSITPDVMLQAGIFDDEFRIVEATAVIATQANRDVIIGQLDSALRPSRWTNVVLAMQNLMAISGLACVYIVTDGTIDPPPGAAPDYFTELSAAAGGMAKLGVRVMIIANPNAAGSIWENVARQTSGSYLVNPNPAELQAAISAVLSADTPTPGDRSSTVSAAPNTLAPRPAAAPDHSHSGLYIPAALTSTVVFTAGLTLLVRRHRTRPQLTGTIELLNREDVARGS